MIYDARPDIMSELLSLGGRAELHTYDLCITRREYMRAICRLGDAGIIARVDNCVWEAKRCQIRGPAEPRPFFKNSGV